MFRRGRILAVVTVLVLLVAIFLSAHFNQESGLKPASDAESGCTIGGIITHTPSGDTTIISRETEFPLLDVSSKQKSMLFSETKGTEYEVKVFQYIASEAYNEHFGRGFVLRFFSENGEQWSMIGSGVFAFYRPSSDGTKHLEGRTAISGIATGLNLDGSGGHVMAQLEPARDAVLAAYFSLDLVIECPRQ